MNYLIINGSPHKGNTWMLVEQIKKDIAPLSPESAFEEIHLMDLNLPFCTGCSLCFRKDLGRVNNCRYRSKRSR